MLSPVKQYQKISLLSFLVNFVTYISLVIFIQNLGYIYTIPDDELLWSTFILQLVAGGFVLEFYHYGRKVSNKRHKLKKELGYDYF